MVTAITLPSLYNQENIAAFVHEALRLSRPGGVVLSIDIASGWYGGELSEIILGKPRAEMGQEPADRFFPQLGFQRITFDTYQDYGSVEHLARSYGFIFGKRAIDYIRAQGLTTIRWRFHLHYRVKEEASTLKRPG